MTPPAYSLVLAACLGTGALAQSPARIAGVAQRVDGLVTVSQGGTLGLLKEGASIADGARVANTSSGSVFIRLASGCGMGLVPGQAVTMDARLDCKAQKASVESKAADNRPAMTGKGFVLPAQIAQGLALGLKRRQSSSGS